MRIDKHEERHSSALYICMYVYTNKFIFITNKFWNFQQKRCKCKAHPLYRFMCALVKFFCKYSFHLCKEAKSIFFAIFIINSIKVINQLHMHNSHWHSLVVLCSPFSYCSIIFHFHLLLLTLTRRTAPPTANYLVNITTKRQNIKRSRVWRLTAFLNQFCKC